MVTAVTTMTAEMTDGTNKETTDATSAEMTGATSAEMTDAMSAETTDITDATMIITSAGDNKKECDPHSRTKARFSHTIKNTVNISIMRVYSIFSSRG